MTSLQEFIATIPTKVSPTQRWFDERPELVDEIRTALASDRPPTASVIMAYLRRDHGCLLADTTLRHFIDGLR